MQRKAYVLLRKVERGCKSGVKETYARRARAAGAAELLMSLSANSCVQAMADVVRFDSSFGDDRFCSHRLVNWFRMPNFLMTNWVLAGTVLVLPVFHFRFSRS